MQCGRGTSVGDRLVENYSGLLPLLWKAVLRYKEKHSGDGIYEKLSDRNDGVLDSGPKYYHKSVKPSLRSSFISSRTSSRRRRWRVMFRVPKVQGSWGGLRPAHSLRRY
ncbi:hypothetical protein M758_1G021000 [Ceratodon purpureus]|uniref:Uncharacterized protein n=1 Tax=Ceratodon purpureus TaxID=3225 RepID=A0A8T0J1J1_CERPU|nr:hypothetical protein KC19_1G022200 [Ceratodon purpureus]KAG0628360.1 hypothetical protein M758_1G021000 [Ceratodon purpureus]